MKLDIMDAAIDPSWGCAFVSRPGPVAAYGFARCAALAYCDNVRNDDEAVTNADSLSAFATAMYLSRWNWGTGCADSSNCAWPLNIAQVSRAGAGQKTSTLYPLEGADLAEPISDQPEEMEKEIVKSVATSLDKVFSTIIKNASSTTMRVSVRESPRYCPESSRHKLYTREGNAILNRVILTRRQPSLHRDHPPPPLHTQLQK